MSRTDGPSALEQVYAARDGSELAAAYEAWSNTYDRETAALGYCLPFLIAAGAGLCLAGGMNRADGAAVPHSLEHAIASPSAAWWKSSTCRTSPTPRRAS